MEKVQKEFIFAGTTYKIETGHSIPALNGVRSPWLLLYEKMEIGESVLLPTKEGCNMVALVNSTIKRRNKNKKQYVARRKVDEENSRVWKVA